MIKCDNCRTIDATYVEPRLHDFLCKSCYQVWCGVGGIWHGEGRTSHMQPYYKEFDLIQILRDLVVKAME